MQLVVHPASAIMINSVKKNLPQGLLLSGDEGVGISAIARDIAAAYTAHPIVVLPEKDEKIDLEKGTISVDIIRRLYDQTRSKQLKAQVFIIDYADRMSRQAQNAFLKLLEEPNASIHFILAAHKSDTLLPTIRSRTQQLHIHRATSEQSGTYLDTLGVTDATKRAQLLFMANGRPAELYRLVHDDEYFSRRATVIRDARTLLQGSPYERLLIANAYKDNRPNSLTLLDDTIAIARRTLSQKPQPELISYLDRLLGAYAKIEGNGNIRLVLASLMI